MVFILGQMEEGMRDIGRIITCMDKESILGEMAENMMDHTLWIKSMDLESTFGLMEGNTKGSGKMEDSMERVNILQQMER